VLGHQPLGGNVITSGSRTSETGAKFLPKFFHDLFLGISEKMSAFPEKN